MNYEFQQEVKKANTEFLISGEEMQKGISERHERLKDIRDWLANENEKQALRKDLQDRLNAEEIRHKENLKLIQKERSQAIDELRKEMLISIRNVKIQMLSMNEDQLQGTTKLTGK